VEQSNEIDKLAGALAKAQGKMVGALKDSNNPFFKSKYADLAACWDACRTQLSDNGLSVVQLTDTDEQGVVVVTTLAHESGQWMRGKLRMMPKDATPQGIGSAITYARRYALAAIVGLAQVDDDGNAASGRAGTVVDPKGELDQRSSFDPAERDKYVSRFLDAFNMDAEELEIARVVESIHKEIAHRHDLYIAVGEGLGSKKNAIRKYIDMVKKQKAVAA
jgi:hypothetical protein